MKGNIDRQGKWFEARSISLSRVIVRMRYTDRQLTYIGQAQANRHKTQANRHKQTLA